MWPLTPDTGCHTLCQDVKHSVNINLELILWNKKVIYDLLPIDINIIKQLLSYMLLFQAIEIQNKKENIANFTRIKYIYF